MENVVPIADLDTFIHEAVGKIRRGLALARQDGVLVMMPEQIQFDIVLVKQWQALEYVVTQTGNDNSVQGGTVTDVKVGASTDNGTETGTETGTEAQTSTDTETGTSSETGTDTSADTEVGTSTESGTDTSTDTETGTSTETGTEAATDTTTVNELRQAQNAHDQSQETETSYT